MSLLRLQRNELNNEQDIKPFQESINRISSMALIHEQMYQGDFIKEINLKTYLTQLTANLLETYSDTKNTKIIVHTTVKSIEINQLVPLSLILNELVTNSIKHNSSDKKLIKIEINFKNNSLLLNYFDNGNWKKPSKESSFGLELIKTFTEQLDGSFSLKIDSSIEYYFKFPKI